MHIAKRCGTLFFRQMRSIIIIAVYIAVAACDTTRTVEYFGTEYEIDKKAVDLNEEAVRIMTEYPDSLNFAIDLLGQSIKTDSNYYIAYENKINWESGLKEHGYGIPTLKAFIKRFPEHPSAYLALGFRQERMGNKNAAKAAYRKSREILFTKMEKKGIALDSVSPELFVLNYVNGDTSLALRQFGEYKTLFDSRGIYRNRDLEEVVNNLKETY